MNMEKVMEKADQTKEYISKCKNLILGGLGSAMKFTSNFLQKNIEIVLLFTTLIIFNLSLNEFGFSWYFTIILLVLIFGAIQIYNLIVDWLSFKEDQYYLDSVDLELLTTPIKDDLGNPVRRSLTGILDAYIEEIFATNVLFFKVFEPTEYINKTTENELLGELIDNVQMFMSEAVKRKLSLYYGDENIDLLIGRRCFMLVSIYVADHNKQIYKE